MTFEQRIEEWRNVTNDAFRRASIRRIRLAESFNSLLVHAVLTSDEPQNENAPVSNCPFNCSAVPA